MAKESAPPPRHEYFRYNGNHITRGPYLIIALFVATAFCLLAISQLQANILDAVRAYVAAEGLWSKGQKDAVYCLTSYARSRDEADYQAFVAAITVPLGDRKARMALQQPEPDREQARIGFLQGGNHPDDIDKLIDFFVDFENLRQMESAILTWTEGDEKIAELRQLGETLHAAITANRADTARIPAILAKVGAINSQLTELETRFSSTLGGAARWSRKLTRNVMLGSLLLLLGTALLLSWRIVHGIHRTEQILLRSEARFRRIVDSNMVGIFFWQSDGTIYDANDAFLQMLGYDFRELESDAINWLQLTPPENRQDEITTMQEIVAHGSCTPFEKEYIHKDGHRIPVYFGGALLDEPQSRGVAFVLDITERHKKKQMQRLAATVFRAAAEAIIVTDSTPAIQAVNPAFTLVTGYTEKEVLGKNPNILNSGRQDSSFYHEMWRELEESGRWSGEIWNRRKNGQVFPEWLSIGVIRNQQNKVVQYVGIFTDITDRKAKEDVIWHQAHYDTLTDLPNRDLFRDRLSQQIALAKRENSLIALMFIDLDRFKQINDTLGHRAGDLLLQEVAKRLSGNIRESDTIARLSGDEFTVILPHLHHRHPAQDAELVAQEIISAFSSPCVLRDKEVTITVSIGIAFYPNDALTMETLMNRADKAMYAAKKSGRNNFRFYTGKEEREPDQDLPD